MVNHLVAIAATPTMHEILLKEMDKRKYPFTGGRKGYNKPEITELKFYDIRIKKECLPMLVRDLGGVRMNPEEMTTTGLWDVLKGPKQEKSETSSTEEGAFMEGRMMPILKYIIQKISKRVRIFPTPPPAEGPKDDFNHAWRYVWHVGTIKDIDRGYGEEL